MHISRLLSQLLQDNTDLGTSEEECFANISEAADDTIFPTMADIAHEQKVDTTLQQFFHCSSE